MKGISKRERIAQQNCMTLWAEVEARNWEERNSDIAFHEMNQEFESQRLQLHQASRRADQAQRDKKSDCVENRNWEIGSFGKIIQGIGKKLQK